MNLPPELAERFSIVEELGAGGEGFVLRVQDAAGAEFVVKLYFPNLTFDERATALLAAADQDHVLSVAPGVASDGSRFEVLEWCEPGTLRDLLNEGRRLDVVTVVAELAMALEHVHGLRLDGDADARLVHQDLKPDNVMVRTLEPLDLVLGDFGLARLIAGSRHYTNRQQGSRAWAPPSGEAVTAGWDWWSLGMIVAEVAAGRHPFCIDGEWLSDAAISDHLSQSPVDLSDIDDDRVRTLCRGLLTRRTTDRWGASEVRRWLAGETVRVVADAGGGQRRRRTVLFNGTEYAEPVELALALQQDWDQAQERLIQRTDGGALSQQVALFLAAAGLTDAESLLKDTDNPPTRLANLLAEMNPDLPPIYRGHDIRPAALSDALTDRARSANAVQLIGEGKDSLIETGVITAWRHLQEMEDGPAVLERLGEARTFVTGNVIDVPEVRRHLSDGVLSELVAATYATAINPEMATSTRAAVGSSDTSHAERQKWWARFYEDGTSPYAPGIALLTRQAATEQSVAEDKRRQAQEEAARQAAIQRERDQQEREQTERRQRRQSAARARVARDVTAFWVAAGLCGTVLGPYLLGRFPLRDTFPRDAGLGVFDPEVRADGTYFLSDWTMGCAVVLFVVAAFVLARPWTSRLRTVLPGLAVAVGAGWLIQFSIDEWQANEVESAVTLREDPYPYEEKFIDCGGDSLILRNSRNQTVNINVWAGRARGTDGGCNLISVYKGWQQVGSFRLQNGKETAGSINGRAFGDETSVNLPAGRPLNESVIIVYYSDGTNEQFALSDYIQTLD